MKILLTGATGFLGSCLHEVLRDAGHRVLAASRREGAGAVTFDLRDGASVAAIVARTQPDVVIHAAAIADLAACERDPALAFDVNARAAEALAISALHAGARVVLISTDQVFSGERGGYREADAPGPVNVYGASKLEAEERVARVHAGALALRLPLLYGQSRHERGATATLLAAIERGERPRLFTDEYRSPLSVSDAARAIGELATSGLAGLYHLGGPCRLSRFELGALIAAQHGFPASALTPAQAADVPTPPRRPRDVSLVSDRVRPHLTTRLRAPEEAH